MNVKKIGSVLKWMGIGALRVGETSAPIGVALGGPTAPAIVAGVRLLADVVHGAVSKAQEDHPHEGQGETRAIAAWATAEPWVKVGLTVADMFLPGDINVDKAVISIRGMLRCYADLLEALGLRKNLPAPAGPSPAAPGLGAGVNVEPSKEPGS